VSLIVIAGVLLMVLMANAAAGRLRSPTRWLYAPLIGSILVVFAVPTDLILGLSFAGRIAWTALGLTFFQPECAEAGCAGTGDKGGTFVWDGSVFKRWSDLRFVASAGSWTLLERLTSFGDYSTPRSVIVRGPQGDVALNAQARDSRALAINDLGETLVWRPDTDQIAQRGTLLRFGPDGIVRWQANLVGTVLDSVGMDFLLVASPTNAIEVYDLKRMLRFETSAHWPSTVAAR